MKKPYIRKYCEVDGISVWIVDGNYVRTNLDEEFTNFGQRYQFKFIPKNEFWIDEEHGGNDEKNFYINNMLTLRKLISQGYGYDKAYNMTSKVDKKERKKSKFYEKNFKKEKNRRKILEKVYKKLLKKYSNRIRIWIVRGKIVRDVFFLDFTEGGHDKVYHFIPKNEVWIDDALSSREKKFVILHELHERKLMAKGMNYEEAHHLSSKIEYKYRHKSRKVNLAIRKELKENEKLCL